MIVGAASWGAAPWRLVAVALAVPPAAAAEGRLTEEEATKAFLRHEKVADWLDRYPRRGIVKDATFDDKRRDWTVHVWWGEAGEIATGKVDDRTRQGHGGLDGPAGRLEDGPRLPGRLRRQDAQPNRGLARVLRGLPAGADRLAPATSLRTLDLLVLLSFSVSLWFFNRGDVFESMSLVYPVFAYLLARMVWVGLRGRSPSSRAAFWPVWVLAAATVFLAGFRIGLNLEGSNVIDVGYSGVVGAHRIANGEMPYGHMPLQGKLKACGPADAEGEIRDRVQTNGRCESSNERGDTYGPAAYFAYVPGYLMLGWSGKWDTLPAAHFTSIAFDLLAILGLALVGRRFGGLPLAATLAFAWAAYPFTQYVSNSNTNDAIPPVLLIWGFWLVSSPWARGAFSALAGWTKFSSLIVAPLWAAYPNGLSVRHARDAAFFVAGFAAATIAAFSILLLEPDLLHAARVFWDRTLGWQLTRESPFSIWDWGQYHAAGIPDLRLVQLPLIGMLLVAAVGAAFYPRRRSPLQLAALTAALLIGFEAVLTHWSYLYLPWFFPFAAFAVLAPSRADR